MCTMGGHGWARADVCLVGTRGAWLGTRKGMPGHEGEHSWARQEGMADGHDGGTGLKGGHGGHEGEYGWVRGWAWLSATRGDVAGHVGMRGWSARVRHSGA